MTTYGNLQNDRSQRKALEDLLAGTAPLPAGSLGPGSVPRSVVDELRDIAVPVTRFGAVGDGITYDNEVFQSAIDTAADEGFDLYVPPTADFYRFGSPVYLRSGVRVFGAGFKSYIYNDLSEEPATYGDHFVFLFGNYSAAAFGNETWKTVSSVSEAEATVTLSTAAEAADFSVGTVVILRGGSTWGSPAIYQYQQVNEVLAADSDTGVVTLMYPPPAGMTSGGIAKSGGAISDSLGNPCALVKDIALEGLRLRAGWERWSGYGGALRPVLRNLHIESDALFSHNGLSFGQIDGVRGSFTSKALEFARFCNDLTISRVTAVSDGRASPEQFLAPLQLSEQAHGIQADGLNLKAYAPWAARSAVSIIAASRCRVANSEFVITGNSTSALDISAEATNQIADDNTFINLHVRAIGTRNFDLRVQQSSGGSANRNAVFGCKFKGTTPDVSAYRLAATDTFIDNNHFPNHGTGEVTSAGVREMIGRNNHGSNTFTLSDAGTGTISSVGGTERIYVSATGMASIEGSPALTAFGGSVAKAWALDSGTTEMVGFQIRVPDGHTKVSVEWDTVNLGAGSGDVYCNFVRGAYADGEDTSASIGSSQLTFTASAQHIRKVVDVVPTGVTVAAGDMLPIGFRRQGGQVADTLGNDIGIAGATVRFF